MPGISVSIGIGVNRHRGGAVWTPLTLVVQDATPTHKNKFGKVIF